MKKRSLYLIICILTNISCIHSSSELTIKTNGDTMNYGTDFTAELFIPYQNGFLPEFKIIRDNDTSWLPIDTIKKCAILKAASKRSGEKVFNGILNYTDMKGNKKSEKFSIRYYVKSKKSNDSI